MNFNLIIRYKFFKSYLVFNVWVNKFHGMSLFHFMFKYLTRCLEKGFFFNTIGHVKILYGLVL
jgi:hypothetical protein